MKKNDSELSNIYVQDMITMEHLPSDKLSGVKYSQITWTDDHLGFFYSGVKLVQNISENNSGHKLFYHKVGTNQTDDIVIYDDT